jgi:hypothetical protein
VEAAWILQTFLSHPEGILRHRAEEMKVVELKGSHHEQFKYLLGIKIMH